MRRALPCLLLLLAAGADAGQVLKFSEEGTKDGAPYRSSLTLSVSLEGVRAEATDLTGSGEPKTVVYLYEAKGDRIVPIDPPTGPVVSSTTIAAVEERARAARHRRRPGAFAVTPLRSVQTFGTWTCESWAVRRPGQTTEIVCLADPKALGLAAATRTNLRKMNALFVPFLNAARLAGGDPREGYNSWALEGGFPVRTFRAKDGVVELDVQLASVVNADLSPDLFRAHRSPAPADSAPPPGHTITLEDWALRGMPDAGRPWTGADYDAAAGLFEAAAKENARRLPRDASADSGALFRRLVDPANLAAVREPGPAEERARAGAGILAGVDRISVLWAGAYRDDPARGGELASLMAFTLGAAHEVVPLADTAVASRARAHAALASVVNACLVSLATPGAFRPAERLRLARAVEEHVPPLKAYLPASDQQSLPRRLKKMSAPESDPAVKDALDRTRAALARPAPKAL
ncbi:MAG: hypothetical protein ABI768_14185 [Acidobacteriota bacterium]